MQRRAGLVLAGFDRVAGHALDEDLLALGRIAIGMGRSGEAGGDEGSGGQNTKSDPCSRDGMTHRLLPVVVLCGSRAACCRAGDESPRLLWSNSRETVETAPKPGKGRPNGSD